MNLWGNHRCVAEFADIYGIDIKLRLVSGKEGEIRIFDLEISNILFFYNWYRKNLERLYNILWVTAFKDW